MKDTKPNTIIKTNMTIPKISKLLAIFGSSFLTAKYPIIPPKMFKNNGTKYQKYVGWD